MSFFNRKRVEPIPRQSPGRIHSAPQSEPSEPFLPPPEGRTILDTVMFRVPTFDKSGSPKSTFAWTVRDAFEGTQIFGETGSGKTSGSGAAIARSFLENGFGGLILTAKADDIDTWMHPTKGYVRMAGLSKPPEVNVFGESAPAYNGTVQSFNLDGKWSFNFLDFEANQSGASTQNLVQLFLTAMESGAQNTGHDDAYWMEALRQLLTNAIDLLKLAERPIRLEDIYAVIQSAPQSRAEAKSAGWQASHPVCWSLLVDAEEKAHTADARRNLKQVLSYWLMDFAGLADRTRSVIVSTFTSKVTSLTRSPLFELLCEGEAREAGTDAEGERQFLDIVRRTREGELVILNLPVKRYSEVGRFVQVLIKTVWQRAIERNPVDAEHVLRSGGGPRPVFLWADEAQFFATKEDMLFQTTARSSSCATVYLTQNLNNYYALMPGRDPRATADGLLGNLTTKIFHSNSDPTTNEWAQRLFGKDYQPVSSTTTGQSTAPSVTIATTPEIPVVGTHDFTRLRRGGNGVNRREVDAIIFRGGAGPMTESTEGVIRTRFKQWKDS